jgi:predicted nucleotidyltransferase
VILLDTYHKELQEIFSSVSQPIEVWAYGSRVKGTAHAGSDLDLVIRTRDLKPLNTLNFNTLQQKIQESNIPILVDLKDWASLPASFHRNIEEKYVVLYKS